MSFRHAVELLREGVPSLAAAGEASGPVKRSTVRALPAPVAFDADDARLLSDTVAYYHERLKQSAEALAYLKRRGIDHPEAIAQFRLGVSDRRLGLRLPEKNRKAGGGTVADQQEDERQRHDGRLQLLAGAVGTGTNNSGKD